MKAAIATDGRNVSAHFGRCPEFTIIEVENGVVTGEKVIDNPGHHPGYLPKYFNEMGVTCIIAGGMGGRAQALFNEYGIEQIVGIQGEVKNVISKIGSGTLEGGESLCAPGGGKDYGLPKTECDGDEDDHHHEHSHHCH